MSVFSEADATADVNTATTPSHRATLTGESTVWGFTTPVADKAAATCDKNKPSVYLPIRK